MKEPLNIRFVKILLTGILFSFISLTQPNTANAASCTITVNWSTGHCAICGGPTGNYACNPPYSGSGDWGPKSFFDCVPAGNIVTQVCFNIKWVGCTGSVTLQLNGTSIGTTVTQSSCPCGGCAPNQNICKSFPCPGGWPGYNYGGTNTINPINNGTVCIDRATITITYSPAAPPAPGAISGPTSPCVGSVQTYSIAAVAGATSYAWTVPGGWTINSGQGSTSISVTVGATAGNICVSASNTCGSGPQQCLAVTPISGPAAPATPTGPGTPCEGTSVTYSTTNVPGLTYTWTVPAGWTITGGQGTNSITVTVGSATGNVCVRACNTCGCSAFVCFPVNPTPSPAAPGAIAGPVSPCSGTTQTYSISAVSGASSYQWTVPPGWVILSGNTTTSISVLVGVAGGNVCVRACNGCGCSAFTCKAVIPGTAPAVPVSISGPTSVCPGATNTYSITAIPGATSYSWVVPGGSTINSGQGTTSISVTAGGTSGNISVQACNSCGCSAAQTLPVIVSTLSLSASATNESCNGGCDGTTSVTVSGGTSPFTYIWTGGCTTSSCSSLCAGTYSVTVSDAGGCTAITSTTVLAGPPVLSGFSYNGNQCLNGNSYCFVNTGSTGAGISFDWDFGDGTLTGLGLGTDPLPGPNPSGTYEDPCYVYSTSGSFTVTQSVTNGVCTDVAFFGIVVYSEPTVSIIGTDMSCFGVCTGATNITVNGGQSPYNYLWSSGPTSSNLTALCAGIYTITVTDANSCTVTASYTVIEPPLLTNTPSGTNVTCNLLCDGTATAIAGGGTGTYTYIWNDPSLQTTSIATGLCAGTFNSTVTDANGCTATATQIITEPAAMVLTFVTVDATCGASDGSACVTVTGGTSPFTYSWDDPGTQTNNCAVTLFGGGYNVLVTDVNGCTNTGAVTVNTTASVTASVVVDNMVFCNGGNNGSATVSAVGGLLPHTYSWNTSPVQTNATATGLTAGTWTATVFDNAGCTDAVTVVITEPPLLSAAILTSSDPNCFGGSDGTATVTVSGGSGSYTYSWGPTGGTLVTGTGLSAGILYTVTVTDSLSCVATATITLGEPAVLVLSIAGTDPSCNGGSNGSANLTVSGGSPGYNYLWSNGPISEDITNVVAGTYTVTVTDLNGCTDNISVVLGEPTAITLTTTVVDAYCGLANGSVCVTAAGGTGTYTYVWNDPGTQTNDCATGLFGGITYSVTVTDANNCSATATDVVNDLPGGVTTVTLINNASGFGLCDGAAIGTMTGGVGPSYTYSWNDPLLQSTATADSLCAGTVCITITDNAGCVSTDCITITEPSAISDTIVGTDVNCNGDCNGEADLTVSGGVPPYTFLWTPGNMITEDLIGLCAGTYVVDITDANGITSSNSIVINEPLVLAVNMAGNPANCNNICDGDATGVASGGTPPYTYLWDDSGTQTTSTATGLCDGTYNITLTDSLGCTTSNTFTVTEPLAVIVATTVTNATCGQSDGTATANVTNGVGPFTYSWDDINTQTNQTATGIPSGPYVVIVTDATGCIGSGSAAISDDAGAVATITGSSGTSCFGVCDGGATVAATGGTAPYTYLWSPTGQITAVAVNLCAGIHVAEVTDATGCTSTATVTIVEPGQLIATATILTDPNCNGSCDGVAIVVANGGTSPYYYQWDDPGTGTNDNVTGLCAGALNIVVTDTNNCTASDNLLLVEPLALSLTLTTVDPGCNGDATGSATVVATGGTIAYTYTWSNGDNGQIADSLSAGTYNIQVTDANLCAVIASVTINEPNVLIASIFATQDVDCNGNCTGFASVTQSGGTSPYSWVWSDGQSSPTAVALCPGVYDVTVTDDNGCLDVTSATITQPNAMILSISKSDVLCNGACDGTATVTVNGGFPPYNYEWNDLYFQTTAMADSLCDGVFQVIVTDTAGCSAFANVLIVQPNALGIILASVDSSNCGNQDGGACVNIAGGDVPYFVQWSAPGLPIGTCIDSVFAGVYTVYVVDINFCFDSMLVAINDIGAAIIDSVATVDDNCYGDSIGSAEVTSFSNASGGITYLWKDANGDTIAFGAGASSVPNLGGGTYTVTIIDGGSGCLTTEIVVINQPSPVFTAITLSNTIDISCNGLCDGRLTVSQSGGTLPYTYSWLPTSTDVTPMADSLCAGNHIVVVTDADGCQDSSSAVITEPAALTAIATVTNISCYGGSDGIIDLLPTPTGGTVPYACTWYPPGTAGNVPTATNLLAGTDTVVITDFKGCTDTVIATVTEPSELIIDTTVTVADNCGSQQGSATVTPAGGTPAYTYSWNTSPPQADSMATGLLAGVYDVTVTDAKGCTSSGPVTVPGTPGPIIDSAVVVNLICNGGGTGSATVLVSSGTTPFTYTWNTTPIQTNATATGLSGGQYIATVTDANGCQDIKIVTVTEPAPMNLLPFQSAFLICDAESAQITIVPTGGTPPYNYSWNNALPNLATHSVSPDDSTAYIVIVTDSFGCFASDTIIILANPALSITSASVEICDGQTGTLSAFPTAGNGGPYTVTWDDGTNTTSGTVLGGDSSTVSQSPSTTTNFMIVVSDGCSYNDTTYASIILSQPPVAAFYTVNTVGCSITFIDTSKGTTSFSPIPSDTLIDFWEWNFGDGTIIGPGSGLITGSTNTTGMYNNPTHFYATAGTYTVTVTVTDYKGCTNALTLTNYITVSPPTANFSQSPDPAILSGTPPNATAPVDFTDLSFDNVTGWFWNFGDPISGIDSTSIDQNPTHVYSDSGDYNVTLVVTDVDGCVSTITRVVSISNSQVLFIPNIFAPNDITKSNVLFVSGVGIKTLSLVIYDRWGEKIFETSHSAGDQPGERADGNGSTFGEGWNGTKAGRELSPQVFVYYLEATFQDGEEVVKKGNITLVK